MKNSIAALLFLAFSAVLNAYFVNGIVKDTDGKPIPDVWVETILITIPTATEGTFTLNLTGESQVVTFRKIGYVCKSVTLVNTDERFTIILEKAPVPLSGIHVESTSLEDRFPGAIGAITIPVPETQGGNLAQLVERQSNAFVQGLPLPGERQTISLLGFKSRHLTVLLDGIPLNAAGEDFDLSTIPAESIERMELLQNNTSSLSGSGGMGGMLSIHTRQWGSDGNSSFETTFGGGSLGYQKESYRSFLSTPVIQTMFYYSRQSADNDFSYKTNVDEGTRLTRDDNHKFTRNIILQAGLVQKKWNFHYLCDFQDFNKQLPGPVNFLLVYKGAKLTGEVLRQSLDTRYGKEENQLRLMLYQNRENTLYDNTRAPLPVYYMQSRNDLLKSGMQGSWDKLWKDIKSHTMLEYWKEDYSYQEATSPSHDIPAKSQELFAAAQQVEFIKDISDFSLHGMMNGRIDHHDLFDHFTTYRFSMDATYKSWGEITTGSSYGTGFTVPSFYSLYWKGEAQAIGNADLEPERSEGWQVFGKVKYDGYSFKAGYHQNHLKDMILWLQAYQWGGVWKPVNIARAKMESIILEASANPIPILNLTAIYTHTSAIDRSLLPDGSHSAFYGKKLVYLPEKMLRLGALLDGNRQFLHLYYNYTGKQWTKTDNLLPPLKPFGIVDAEAGWSFLQKNWKESMVLNANNVLDHRYEIYPYIPQPGFNWQLQLNITYKINGGTP